MRWPSGTGGSPRPYSGSVNEPASRSQPERPSEPKDSARRSSPGTAGGGGGVRGSGSHRELSKRLPSLAPRPGLALPGAPSPLAPPCQRRKGGRPAALLCPLPLSLLAWHVPPHAPAASSLASLPLWAGRASARPPPRVASPRSSSCPPAPSRRLLRGSSHGRLASSVLPLACSSGSADLLQRAGMEWEPPPPPPRTAHSCSLPHRPSSRGGVRGALGRGRGSGRGRPPSLGRSAAEPPSRRKQPRGGGGEGPQLLVGGEGRARWERARLCDWHFTHTPSRRPSDRQRDGGEDARYFPSYKRSAPARTRQWRRAGPPSLPVRPGGWVCGKKRAVTTPAWEGGGGSHHEHEAAAAPGTPAGSRVH